MICVDRGGAVRFAPVIAPDVAFTDGLAAGAPRAWR